MQVPVPIAFRNVDRSERIEELARTDIAKLEESYGRITSCHVVIEQPNRRHRVGDLYHVRIHIAVPGRELIVDREPPEDHSREDLSVTLRDPFNAMRRQLDDYAREIRGDKKAHQTPRHARVARLFPEAGYGFLETTDGKAIYFHANSVLNDGFSKLQAGTEVRYTEEAGDKGPQASSIQLGRHHHIVE